MSNFPHQIGFTSNPSGDPSADRADRAERGHEVAFNYAESQILDSSVRELLEWFIEDSEEADQIRDLVAKAANDQIQLDLEFERY